MVGYGTGVGMALGAAELLADRGLDVTVADARFAKPLDAALLAQLAAEHDLVVTVEEGVLMGGFGTAVWESLAEGGLAPRMLRIGLPDRYVTHGAPRLLHEEVGFTPERIAERIEAAVAAGRDALASSLSRGRASRLAASSACPRRDASSTVAAAAQERGRGRLARSRQRGCGRGHRERQRQVRSHVSRDRDPVGEAEAGEQRARDGRDQESAGLEAEDERGRDQQQAAEQLDRSVLCK